MNDHRLKLFAADEFDVGGDPVETWPVCDARLADRFLGAISADRAILIGESARAPAHGAAEPVEVFACERDDAPLRETLRTLRLLVADTPAAWARPAHVAMSREMIVRLIDEALENETG